MMDRATLAKLLDALDAMGLHRPGSLHNGEIRLNSNLRHGFALEAWRHAREAAVALRAEIGPPLSQEILDEDAAKKGPL